jgi:hypothetical protein
MLFAAFEQRAPHPTNTPHRTAQQERIEFNAFGRALDYGHHRMQQMWDEQEAGREAREAEKKKLKVGQGKH